MRDDYKPLVVIFTMFLVVMFCGTSYAKYQSRNSGSHMYHSHSTHHRKG